MGTLGSLHPTPTPALRAPAVSGQVRPGQLQPWWPHPPPCPALSFAGAGAHLVGTHNPLTGITSHLPGQSSAPWRQKKMNKTLPCPHRTFHA